MAITGILRKDHQILRKKLEFLEATLQVVPHTPFVLREMCHSLARILDEHIHREEQMLAPYANRIRAILRAREHQDHADQRLVLKDINAMLLEGVKIPTSRVVSHLSQLIDELREHMLEEEREVFPVIEQAEAPQPPPVPQPLITEAMSANAVMRRFPATKAVFKKYGIECGCDGCGCLDEVAWRVGLEGTGLVEELRQAIAAEEPVTEVGAA